jgi:site-specific DNA-methyltransferase (adenine-specific)
MQINGFQQPPPLTLEYLGAHGMLFRADALQLLANIKDSSVDLVFADPPFNLGKDYNTPDFRDEIGTEFYKGWCRTWLLEVVRVLKPGGSLFLYHLPKWLIELGHWLNTIHGVEYKSWIALNMKSGFPIKGRIHPAHYGMLHYIKKGATPTFNTVRTKSPTCRHCKKLIRDYGGYIGKYQRFQENGDLWVQISDFWDDTRPARQEKSRSKLVNELPVQVPERAILMATKPGDVVLDCFGGGGSTFHAAELTGRIWIGGEIGKPVAILRRIATFFGTTVERKTVPTRLRQCFQSKFLTAILQDRPLRRKTPIAAAGKLPRVEVAADKYASRSRVFEASTTSGSKRRDGIAATKKNRSTQTRPS